ncbi:tol-pal system YbgF family protein [Novosphingobium sp. ST904]|uniref:tetratricopeptide repeat protein n=1 Tax=Novosphingobium sp. ST904 TaxID=1684385 RepID=UPI0006C85CFD|nr:hypothetical protein [Novosphingobium sp. ST904]TCM38426.1 hypothetical protein EDF59_108116 [Novosphingobium sp. ST904]
MTLARTLLAEGKYAEADRILTDLVHRSNNSETYFLKGVSSLGTGQSASARTYFKSVLMSRKTRHAGAMTGLALSEIQLGNRPAAERILETLKSQDDRCDGRCSRSTSIEQAVSTVEKALG